MKKHILFVVSLIALLLLAGCSDSDVVFTEKDYTAKGAEVAAIRIDVRDSEIRVSPSENGQVHIDYLESDQEFFDLSLSDDGVLTMTAATDKEWKDYIGSRPAGDRAITLRVPDALLRELTIATTNEDIVLAPLTVSGDVSLSVSGGDIAFDQMQVEQSLHLTAKNGDISGAIVGGYDDFEITCTVKKGESNLPAEKLGGGKTLQVSGNNGDIDIQFVQD